MKILFWIEPLIMQENPYWNTAWILSFSNKIVETLKSSKKDFEFTYAINEALIDIEHPKNITEITFSQKELLSPFENNFYYHAAKTWYEENYSKEQMDYYKALLKDKFKSYKPDIIISFMSAPFLKEIFPDARILYHELGFLSRTPFLQTKFIDPQGVLKNSSYAKFATELKDFKITPKQNELVEKFKTAVKSLFIEKNPFIEIIKSSRQKFDKLLLFPLQTSNYGTLENHIGYRTQYDFLTNTLDKIPPNIGVIVTKHPEHNILSLNTIDFLKKKYPNLIYHTDFEKYYGASSFLLADVDGLICATCSLAQQNMIWGKKVFSLAQGVHDSWADANSLKNIEEILEAPSIDTNNILYWFLTRYLIPVSYIENPDWLSNFIITSIKKEPNFDFFEPIDNDEKIINQAINSLSQNIPIKNPILSSQKSPNSSGQILNHNNYLQVAKALSNDKTQAKIKKFINENQNKKIAFYGAGLFAEEFVKMYDLSKLNVVGFFDRDPNKVGTSINNYKIHNREDLGKFQFDQLVLCVQRPHIVIDSLEIDKDKIEILFD